MKHPFRWIAVCLILVAGFVYLKNNGFFDKSEPYTTPYLEDDDDSYDDWDDSDWDSGASAWDSGNAHSSAVSDTSGGAAEDAAFTVPDPVLVLDHPNVTVTDNAELEINGEIFLFTMYIYEITDSHSLAADASVAAYQVLSENKGLTLENLYSDGTYNEFAIAWDEYLLGYLTTDSSEWVLFLPSDVALDDTPSPNPGSGSSGGGSSSNSSSSSGGFLDGSFQNDSYVDGPIGGSFQNESYGITVRPGETFTDTGPTTMVCESCNGSGRCDACGGDGLADSFYDGQHNSFECGVCDIRGVCPVCDGTGVWEFD